MKTLFAMLGMIGFLFFACGEDPVSVDTVDLEVSSTIPKNGATEVSCSVFVAVNFSGDIQLKRDYVSATSGGEEIPVSLYGTGKSWSIRPQTTWPDGELVSIKIRKDAGLEADFNFNFRTKKGPAPVVFGLASISPTSGEVGPETASWALEFTKEVNPASAPSNIFIAGASANLSTSGKTVYVTAESLPEGETITLKISRDLKSSDGNTLSRDYSFEYQVKVKNAWMVGPGWKFRSGASDHQGAIYGGGGHISVGTRMDSSLFVKFTGNGKTSWTKKEYFGDNSYTNLVASTTGYDYVYRTIMVKDVNNIGSAENVRLQALSAITGEIVKSWELGPGASLSMVTAGENVIVSQVTGNNSYLKLFSPTANQPVKTIDLEVVSVNGLWFENGFVYAGGKRNSSQDSHKNGIQVYKFDDHLDQMWHRNYFTEGITSGGGITVINGTIFCVGTIGSTTPSVSGVMYKLTDAGGLEDKILISTEIGIVNQITTDGNFIFKVEHLVKIDQTGHYTKLKDLPGSQAVFFDDYRGWVFTADDLLSINAEKMAAYDTGGVAQN